MKTIHVLATAAAALSLLGSTALAQAASGMKAACAADMQRLCPTAAPGHGAMRQCFKSHMSEISPGCHSAMEAAKAARAQRKAAAAAAASSAQSAPAAAAAPTAH